MYFCAALNEVIGTYTPSLSLSLSPALIGAFWYVHMYDVGRVWMHDGEYVENSLV